MLNKKYKIIFISIVLIISFFYICFLEAYADSQYAIKINESNPGMKLDLKKYIAIGKITIFCFYTESDERCKKIIPLLEKMDRERSDTIIYLLNVEPKDAIKLQGKHPLRTQYDINQVPEYFIFNPKGKFIHRGTKAAKILSQLLFLKIKTSSPRKKKINIHKAALTGNEVLVKEYISKGLNLSQRDNRGWTPLHYAVFAGKLPIVKILLIKGVNPNIKTIRGETSLHLAAGKGFPLVIKELIKQGANPNITEKIEGTTPLHWAVHFNKKMAILALLQGKAKVNIRDKKNFTALDLAVNEGKGEFAKILARYTNIKLPNQR